ncbi:MAG: glutaredoxin family protein [Solirubrobacteraceae bacterium]
MSVVTLYSKPGCHLCEEALAVLRRAQERAPFELFECDITSDEALHRAYFERIPVVMLDGEHLFDYFVDEQALIERLESRRWPTTS